MNLAHGQTGWKVLDPEFGQEILFPLRCRYRLADSLYLVVEPRRVLDCVKAWAELRV